MTGVIRHGEPLMPSPEKLADLQERLAKAIYEGNRGGKWEDVEERTKHEFRGFSASALMWMRETVQLAMEGFPRGD